jgi:hypothetical protein
MQRPGSYHAAAEQHEDVRGDSLAAQGSGTPPVASYAEVRIAKGQEA